MGIANQVRTVYERVREAHNHYLTRVLEPALDEMLRAWADYSGAVDRLFDAENWENIADALGGVPEGVRDHEGVTRVLIPLTSTVSLPLGDVVTEKQFYIAPGSARIWELVESEDEAYAAPYPVKDLSAEALFDLITALRETLEEIPDLVREEKRTMTRVCGTPVQPVPVQP